MPDWLTLICRGLRLALYTIFSTRSVAKKYSQNKHLSYTSVLKSYAKPPDDVTHHCDLKSNNVPFLVRRFPL